jgi:hypothetical protein
MLNYYDAVLVDGQIGLGEGTTTAKLRTYAQSSAWAELVRTYMLFGDPATELNLPAQP